MYSLGTNSLRLEVILVNTFLSCSFKGRIKKPNSVIIRMYYVLCTLLDVEYICTTHVSYFVSLVYVQLRISVVYMEIH